MSAVHSACAQARILRRKGVGIAFGDEIDMGQVSLADSIHLSLAVRCADCLACVLVLPPSSPDGPDWRMLSLPHARSRSCTHAPTHALTPAFHSQADALPKSERRAHLASAVYDDVCAAYTQLLGALS